MPGQQQDAFGAGERDVEQAAFLDEAAGVERVLVRLDRELRLLAVDVPGERERREVGGVAPQGDGQVGG
mgnify:CR=1 FL=1